MEGDNSIKAVQMGLLTFFAQTGVGIIMLPSSLAKEVDHDGWISVIMTGVIISILSIFILLLLKRYTDKAIYDINALVFGKFIGFALNLLLLFYLITAIVAGGSLFNYFIRITLLQKTPSWILSPFITLPSLYLVWQGLKSMSRFLYISTLNYLVVIIFIALLYKDIRISFLMPLGEAGLIPILNSVKTNFFAFSGFELIAFFYPYIVDKKKALKWHTIAVFSSMIFFAIIVAVSTAVFGENFLEVLSMPFFNLSRVYNAPIFERVDLYLIALWFIPMACAMRCYVFAAFDGVQKVFKLQKTRVLYSIFFTSMLIASSIIKDFNQVLNLIKIVNMMGMWVGIFLVLCFVLSFFRQKGVDLS